MNNDFGVSNDGHAGWGFAAIECAVKVNDNGTFGVYFDNLETMVIMAMFHPRLVDVVMPQVWAAADEKGINLKS